MKIDEKVDVTFGEKLEIMARLAKLEEAIYYLYKRSSNTITYNEQRELAKLIGDIKDNLFGIE